MNKGLEKHSTSTINLSRNYMMTDDATFAQV